MNCNRFLCSAIQFAPVVLVVAILGGCGPRISSEDLGTILHDIPKVSGAEKPYPMPQLDESPSPKDETAVSDESGDNPKPEEADDARPAANSAESTPAPAPSTESPPEQNENQFDSTTKPQE